MGTIPESYLPPRELWPEYVIPEEYDIFPEKTNLAAELLDHNLKEGRGDIVAVYFQDQRITFSELAERVNRLGNSLLELGVEPLDRVGIRFVNSPDAIVANFAIQKIGAIPLPMSPLWSWHEIEFSSNNAETVAIIVSAPLAGEVMKSVDKMQFNKHVIISGGGPDAAVPGTLSMGELVQKGSPELEPVMVGKRDIGVLLYTSGTTGPPKGCIHFVEELLVETEIVGKYVWDLQPGDVLGGSAPVTFAAGYGTFGIIPFRFGAGVSLLPKFIPEDMLAQVGKHGITVFTGLPTAYRKLLTTEGFENYDLSSVKRYTTGGDSLGTETFEAWKEKTGQEIYEGLGTTEMVHLVTSNTVAPAPNPKSIGLPLPGFEVVLFNEEGEECKPGEIGILSAKGPTGTLYWRPYDDDNRLLKNQEAKIKDGYNLLGDAVYQDEEGYIFFVSREEDMIKSSGYRIGPAEVEDTLIKHPAVADAGVIGVPDELLGSKTKAFIVLKEGYEPSEELKEEIINSCREHIAVFKLPRALDFVDSLPRTPTGKLLRRILREK
jgi:2-aminobenzoate-CoA ligase